MPLKIILRGIATPMTTYNIDNILTYCLMQMVNIISILCKDEEDRGKNCYKSYALLFKKCYRYELKFMQF